MFATISWTRFNQVPQTKRKTAMQWLCSFVTFLSPISCSKRLCSSVFIREKDGTWHSLDKIDFVRQGNPWNLFIYIQSVVQLLLYLCFLSRRSVVGIGFKLRTTYCFQYFLRLVQSRIYMQKCNSLNVIEGKVNSGVPFGKESFQICVSLTLS